MDSRTSPDPSGPDPFDPAGDHPIVDPDDPERWLSSPAAELSTALFAGSETQRWLEWLDACELWQRSPEAPPGPDAHLDALWDFALRAMDAAWFSGCDWTEIQRHPPVPLWLRLEPGREQVFGWAGSYAVAGVIAAASQWMIDNWSARWVVAEEVGDTPASPCISIPGGRGFLPHVQIVVRVSKTLKLAPSARSATGLCDLLYLHGPGTGGDTHSGSDEPDGPDWMLDPWDDSDSNWGLSMDDMTARYEEDRVEKLVQLLAQDPRIARCIHEDRELILMTSDLCHDALMSVTEDLWESTGPNGADGTSSGS